MSGPYDPGIYPHPWDNPPPDQYYDPIQGGPYNVTPYMPGVDPSFYQTQREFEGAKEAERFRLAQESSYMGWATAQAEATHRTVNGGEPFSWHSEDDTGLNTVEIINKYNAEIADSYSVIEATQNEIAAIDLEATPASNDLDEQLEKLRANKQAILEVYKFYTSARKSVREWWQIDYIYQKALFSYRSEVFRFEAAITTHRDGVVATKAAAIRRQNKAENREIMQAMKKSPFQWYLEWSGIYYTDYDLDGGPDETGYSHIAEPQ